MKDECQFELSIFSSLSGDGALLSREHKKYFLSANWERREEVEACGNSFLCFVLTTDETFRFDFQLNFMALSIHRHRTLILMGSPCYWHVFNRLHSFSVFCWITPQNSILMPPMCSNLCGAEGDIYEQQKNLLQIHFYPHSLFCSVFGPTACCTLTESHVYMEFDLWESDEERRKKLSMNGWKDP